MHALTLTDAPTLVTDQPSPTPAPGEALIRPTRMGISAADLTLAHHPADFTGVLGHEFVGVVEAVGDTASTDRRWVGQRVVGTTHCVCGDCDQCRAGVRAHCRQRAVLGQRGRDGCFAERFTLPVANLLAVPDAVDDDHAVFTAPLAAACQVLRQIAVHDRPFITVLGDTTLGLLTAQVLASLNATVRCVGEHPAKLALCEKWGVKARPLADVGLHHDQDIVIDCTGESAGLATAAAMVRPRGTIVLKADGVASHTKDDAPDAWMSIVEHEAHVIGSRCGPYPEALRLLAAGKIDVASLITRRLKLADAEQALRLAAQRDSIKVLLEP